MQNITFILKHVKFCFSRKHDALTQYLLRELHVESALRTQSAQPNVTLHRIRFPVLLHHTHLLARLMGFCT